MTQLLHLDGDEVDISYRLELSDDDLAKIKHDAQYQGKAAIHLAYLTELAKNIKIADDLDTKYLIEFDHGAQLKPDYKHYKIFMMNFFVEKLIMSNKIGTAFYQKHNKVYLDTLIIGS